MRPANAVATAPKTRAARVQAFFNGYAAKPRRNHVLSASLTTARGDLRKQSTRLAAAVSAKQASSGQDNMHTVEERRAGIRTKTLKEPMNYKAKLSSDIPVTDPAQDAYGFSGFAKNLAKAIRVTPSPHGLVMAIHGPWGAGKSSLLNLVKYELRTVFEDACPIIIDFNPWWFNGRDQLAGQLLAQFGTSLRNDSGALLKIGELMAEYSGALSKAVALSTGTPWIDKPVNVLLKLLKRKPKEVPQLKAEIAKLLQTSKRRVLFIIDDLDRLTPDEIREVFKVVKALADFPNVIYLLSFDKLVVAEALAKSLGVNGSAYLEKIVQASFALPAVDSPRLQRKLFAELNLLIDSLPTARVDSTYWGNVYFDGLNHFIRKPRDIIRLINALAVTYPPVAGEVNPVDYIALEFIRVFHPVAYGTIRDNKEMFAGVIGHTGPARDTVKEFHQKWLGELDERDRSSVQALMERVFPKVESAIGRMNYGSDSLARWHQDLRACSPDLFDVYFQFGLPDDHLTQSELMKLLELTSDLPVLVATLQAAKQVIRQDGRSKARDYVDRLTQLSEDAISAHHAEQLILAVFSMDEDLLTAADSRGGAMEIPNSWRVMWLLNKLIVRVAEADRPGLFRRCIQDGRAYSTMINVVGRLAEAVTDPAKHREWMGGIDEQSVLDMKAAVVARLESADVLELVSTNDAVLVLFNWSSWSELGAVRAKLARVLADDALLTQLLPKFLGKGTSHAWGDRVARTTYHLDPRSLERYFDLDELLARVEALLPGLPADSLARIAAEQYVRGMARVEAGLPTSREAWDDEH